MTSSNKEAWSRATKVITIVATFLIWATSLLGAVWMAAGDRGNAFHAIDDNCKRVEQVELRQEQQELRLRTIEKSTTTIEADVRWIREAMEKRP